MKDFFKIFIILCLCAGTFMYGRNYGQTVFRETEEYQNLVKAQEELSFTKSELENIKTKFQNIAENVAGKNQEQFLAQIIQIMSADLGLSISQESLRDNLVSNVSMIERDKKNQKTVSGKVASENRKEKFELEKKIRKANDYKKIKSYEWFLQNSRDSLEIKKNLNHVEIKDLNSYLRQAQPAEINQLKPIFGSYRGRIIDVTDKEYGTLVIQVNSEKNIGQKKVKGSVKIFKNGQESMGKAFSGMQWGYVSEDSKGVILNNGDRFFQVYKISETQQLVGNFYERLVNGTTKKIGNFILNRTDQF